MNNRTDIKNFIIDAEQRFPVNEWMVEDVHLWPFIRIHLFFKIINAVDGRKKFSPPQPPRVPASKSGLLQIVKNKWNFLQLKSKHKQQLKSWFKSLPQKKYLFVGADAHRVLHEGKRFNRFFDTIITTHNLESESILFEYANTSNEILFNEQFVFKFENALKSFIFTSDLQPNVHLKGYANFLNYLNQFDSCFGYTSYYTENKLKENARIFYIKYIFFKECFKIIRPNKIAILCYYNEDIMSLTAAANHSGIPTIEMQHGPQTDIHLAYGNWTVIPESGYAILPRTYWQWDQQSKSIIDKWAINNTIYKSIVIGNPWINFWKDKKVDYPNNNFILYSLQPYPLSLQELFPPTVIELIKESKFKWFLRLHPRQLDKIIEVRDFLQTHQILHLTEIEYATFDPLPILLQNCVLHVTHFSGSAIEASAFNKFTILLNENGVISFPDIIAKELAIYLDPNDADFIKKFHQTVDLQLNIKKKEINLQSNPAVSPFVL